MAKPTIEMARRISSLAPLNVHYSEAMKLCRKHHPRRGDFDLSNLALWVERMNRTNTP